MGGFEYVLMTLVILFVLILVILLLVQVHFGRGHSYRPGEPWDYEPVIVSAGKGGDADAAVGTTDIGELGMVDEADVIAEVGIGSEGGSSVRW